MVVFAFQHHRASLLLYLDQGTCMYNFLAIWICRGVDFEVTQTQICRKYLLVQLLTQAALLLRKMRFEIGKDRSDNHLYLLMSDVWIWTPSSQQEPFAWTSSEKTFCTSCVSCMFQASLHRRAWKSAIVLLYRIHNLRTNIPCRIPLMLLLSGTSQQYDAKIEKQLQRRFPPVLSWNFPRQISTVPDHIINTALCMSLLFSNLSSVGMSQEFRPAFQLLQTNSTTTKTLSSRPICYCHHAVPLHLHSVEQPKRWVYSVLATIRTHC